MEWYYIVLICVGAFVLLFFVFAALAENVAFGKRADKNPLFKYFTAEDFGLTANVVSLPNGLNGFIYGKAEVEAKDKLIIFCHGMGAGHIAYTTEIAYFCNLGYTVLAIDGRGCNLSDGKNIKGMYSGVQTAIAAIDFARSDDRLKGLDIYLVGHSWGAYSALCASAQRAVKGLVSISAPTTPSKTMECGSSGYITRPIAKMCRPFWWLIQLFKYGAKGNMNAADCAQKSGVPTLLIYGDSDKIVPPANSVYCRAEGKNITKLLVKGKAHNPYNSENAERQLALLSAKLMGVKNVTADVKEYFDNFDFAAATEEDESVMRAIVDFIEKV